MTDNDILISDLNDISEILNNNGYGGWCAAIRKAVSLLKEQKTQKSFDVQDDWFCVDESGKITELVVVVRCKDCKHYRKDTCSAGAGIAYPPPDDWYCADGVKRDD